MINRLCVIGLVVFATVTQAQDNLDAQRGAILDQAAYLKHLEDTKRILQIESEIAALRSQCRAQGFLCGGGEIREIRIEPETRAAPETQAAAQMTLVQDLALVGIVGGRAQINSHGSGLVELVEGKTIGGWRIEEIELDRVHLHRGGAKHVLHLNWVADGPAAEPREGQGGR